MIPTRFALRNRWWTLAWAAGIVWTAANFAGGEGRSLVDAANTQDNGAAQNSALLAEDQ